MHLQAVCQESLSISEVVEELVCDFEKQMKYRIEVLKEEAQN